MTTIAPIECKFCTVPTSDGTDVCTFCRDYTPPPAEPTALQQLTDAVERIDKVRADVNEALRLLPLDAPLFTVTDVVITLNHLRQAAVALDKATDTLEADAEVVW